MPGDLLDAELGPLLENVRYVFHLAAQPGIRGSWGSEYSRQNLEAFQRLLEASAGLPGVDDPAALRAVSNPSAYAPAVHIAALTPPEQRVLGCLIEKRFTTPDQYPLSLNSLRLACNQSTNRDPVVTYDEDTVREAAQRLSRYGLGRLASGHSSRSVKYRHLAEEALGVDQEQLAILCVLLLRGPQTPGELKGRTERMVRFDSLTRVEEVLEQVGDKGYARRLPRRPGQKEDRFEQLLGGAPGEDAPRETGEEFLREPAPPTIREAADDGLIDRIGRLEREVSELRAELRQLRDDIGA